MLKIASLLMIMALIALMGIPGCRSDSTIPSSELPITKPIISDVSPSASPKETTNSPEETIQDPIERNTITADLITLATVTELNVALETHERVEDVYSTYTLVPEKIIKGDTDLKVFYIKLRGGILKDEKENANMSILPSEGSSKISDQVLMCLKNEGDGFYSVIGGDMGVLWAKKANGEIFEFIKINGERMTFDKVLGIIIRTLRVNNIPIALPHEEWPPQPVGPITFPTAAK
jgi:hypothetical protein